MNQTEKRAFKWMTAAGYTGIVFQPNRTPDFLTASGKVFEVKLARKNTIWFSAGQFAKLTGMRNCDILVFSDNDQPDAIIPAVNLASRPDSCNGIRILVGNEDTAYFVVRIPSTILERAKEVADADNRSINWFICHAVEDAIRNANHNQQIRKGLVMSAVMQAAAIEPGIDLIPQRRDGKGRFTRRAGSAKPPSAQQQTESQSGKAEANC